jgi:competence protein ComEA
MASESKDNQNIDFDFEEADALEASDKKSKKKKFNWEKFIYENRIAAVLLIIGIILLGLGVFLLKDGAFSDAAKVEILEDGAVSGENKEEIVAEIAGAVEKPGVYKLESGSRVEDLLIASGGLSADADRIWVEKMVNRAAKLTDGQKLYVPYKDEQPNAESANFSGGGTGASGVQGVGSESLVNINAATQSELESLWGIGPVYAQNIIEHRPYSSVEELLTKKIIKKNVYERNKHLLTVY